MNFVRDVVDASPRERLALIELARDGSRRPWSFGEVSDAAARLGGMLRDAGVERGDVVVTLIGNRSEWVLTMLACFRIGAVVLPCTEQLRAKDLEFRFRATSPSLVVADERNRVELERAKPPCPVIFVPDDRLWLGHEPVAAVDLNGDEPCLITFTSGTSGEPKPAVHAQRYLAGQRLQAHHWLDARSGEIVWCTASSGWSKSARNVFIAPWLMGAATILHDGRFDPDERLGLCEQENVNVLCMAPTEYRVIAKQSRLTPIPSLRTCVAAGEALNAEIIGIWSEGLGIDIRDGYGQTETGQITASPPGSEPHAGSMGRVLPGVEAHVDGGELVIDPATVPTFFLGYLGDDPVSRTAPWRTGDRVSLDDDGYLWFEGRADDVIISSGYRIGPFEIESSLLSHPAVADSAVVASPDAERGSVVRAVVVLTQGYEANETLVQDLQNHVKQSTAPYKYPRRIDFVEHLPKTSSGKVQRALLRDV